jgi:tryptophanyl-tRNA synthetase
LENRVGERAIDTGVLPKHFKPFSFLKIMDRNKKFSVTPWEVTGEVDYEKLVEEFGTQPITPELLEKIKKHTHELHPLLRRGIFFSHRDVDWLLEEYEKGHKFYLYTGRGPSGDVHLGHLVPWMFTKWLQEKFNAELWFQLTDDEKFLFDPKLGLEEAMDYARSNALDVIALGMDPKKTFIFSDITLAGLMYPYAIRIAKRINFSVTRAVFGFRDDTNIGKIFFTSMQAVPAFLKSAIAGKNVPCLIPHAIDQDPHFRVTRDVLPALGYLKPASIHCKFFPGLKRTGKMSASQKENTIFTQDSPKAVKKKIENAFTGGRVSSREQREKGGDPAGCPIFMYYLYFFEFDDEKLEDLKEKCRGGTLLCGECKQILIEKVTTFLENHQEKREKAKDRFSDYWVENTDDLPQE